jgi:DNA segregation ATPase FtsK/SpoIIIE, S-DNA-T family
MAKRQVRQKPKTRGKAAAPAPALFRSEVIGSVLVVLAVVMLLSLLSPNRGDLTGALVGVLQVGFGIGAWFVPVVFGALGFWLVLRKITDITLTPGWRIGAGAALFLVFESSAHLLADARDPLALAMAGGGGGLVGWFIGQGLVSLLGLVVTVGTLVLVTIVSIVVLSGLTLAELQARGAALWQGVRGSPDGPDSWRVNPPLPLGHTSPFWQRWWRRFTEGRRLASSGLPSGGLFAPSTRQTPPAPPPFPATRQIGSAPLADGPARPPTAPRGVAGAGAAPGATSPGNQPGAAAQAAAKGEVAPRIIGSGGQTWRLPAVSDILEDSSETDIQGEDLRQRAQIIEKTLEGFGLPVQVVEANQGPAVTQFGLRPGIIVRRNRKGEEKRVKVRVSQIQALSNDLALALAASPLRIEAPVPGRDVVGVEVPNVQISLVALRGVMESEEFRVSHGALDFGLGRDVSGQSAIADLARMPHLLIAGATGSGKSVCVNAIITTLLLTHTPDSLRFLMVDPKRVELTVYNGIPHLIAPVVVDVERAVPVLQWATREMDRRYKLFAKMSSRNIESYNEKLVARGEQILPYIVVLIDELADLMLSAPDDVERQICRIAQMARATGIHLVIATQRPSVDVVTGLIKANFPARIAFAVTSQIDSRVILDTPGAEQLLGRGDMLFMAPDASKLQRLQGCFVSDRETQRLVRYWKGIHTLDGETGSDGSATSGDEDDQGAMGGGSAGGGMEPPWLPGQETLQQPLWPNMPGADEMGGDPNDMYHQAVNEVRKAGRASVSLLQRRLRIGYSRAARLIDELEQNGVIGPDLGGSRGREVLPETDETGPDRDDQ